jgi:hypothetical protein
MAKLNIQPVNHVRFIWFANASSSVNGTDNGSMHKPEWKGNFRVR